MNIPRPNDSPHWGHTAPSGYRELAGPWARNSIAEGGVYPVLTAVPQILLVDDHPLVLFGMEAALAECPEFRVSAQARSGREALQVLSLQAIDLVLLDVNLPDISGLEVLTTIKRSYPQVKVVLVTSDPPAGQLWEGMRLGADGFLAKDSDRELLCHGVLCVLNGGNVLSSQLFQDCLRSPQVLCSTPVTAAEKAVELKPRELEVLQLVAQGKSNRLIGEHLSLAEVTVKKYLQSILDKFGVSDRTQAAMRGVRLGLIEVNA